MRVYCQVLCYLHRALKTKKEHTVFWNYFDPRQPRTAYRCGNLTASFSISMIRVRLPGGRIAKTFTFLRAEDMSEKTVLLYQRKSSRIFSLNILTTIFYEEGIVNSPTNMRKMPLSLWRLCMNVAFIVFEY